jgi:hypothetical protein
MFFRFRVSRRTSTYYSGEHSPARFIGYPVHDVIRGEIGGCRPYSGGCGDSWSRQVKRLNKNSCSDALRSNP